MKRLEFELELEEILSWWKLKMYDDKKGGFYGRIDGHGRVDENADKSIILNTRILWTFAAAARKINERGYRESADRAFEYIQVNFLDQEKGGVYWMINSEAQAKETKKQIYAQAFAIYALSEYYLLTKNEKAKALAYQLFDLIERHSFDPGNNGYYEAFSKNWGRLEDIRLSEKDANEAKTMNTHLHILEAYTNLYRMEAMEKVGAALKNLIILFFEKFINSKSHHLNLFFDENWKLKSNEISYGHDIECSWLLVEAAEVLATEDLLAKSKEVAIKMTQAVYQNGMDQFSSLYYENKEGHFDTEKHWWPQAESVVGFWNAWQISKEEKYRKAAIDCWQFIQGNLKDRANGEWHWSVDEKGLPNLKEDKAGPWKAPYHNGRMCLEMISRM